MSLPSQPECQQAEACLAYLVPLGEVVTFQTFGEGSHKGARSLSRVLHGTLAQHEETLRQLNEQGAGVFFTVNQTDGKGRKEGNVRSIRALFVDLDGAPLAPVLEGPLTPHLIVESSPGRWHAYWRVEGCPLSKFRTFQKRLAHRFGGDPSVCDLPRVMRLPGHIHRKGAPFMARIERVNDCPPYALTEFEQAFGFDKQAALSNVEKTNVEPANGLPLDLPQGTRNATLFGLACGLARRGYGVADVLRRIQTINAERCRPPLPSGEVEGIAQRASDLGSNGFTPLTDRLMDSEAWKALSPQAQAVILMAMRRLRQGDASKGVAITHSDFKGRPGFAKKDTFYRARNEAMASGILIRTSRAKNSQRGKVPDLFTIAPCFRLSQKGDLGPVPMDGHLIERTVESRYRIRA